MSSLLNKTLSGLLWTLVDTFVLRGMSFISTVILARWLGPEEFGLIGMIAVFIAIGSTIMDSGMSASLIRMRSPTQKDYSTVFILNIVLSAVFYGVIYFSAPAIAAFYDLPVLSILVCVSSCIFYLEVCYA